MEITSALGVAQLGIQRGMEGLERNAAEIASTGQMQGESSPVAPLIDSKLNRLQVEASVSVLRTVDETLGTLFDDKA